jgi:hypothetical protein
MTRRVFFSPDKLLEVFLHVAGVHAVAAVGVGQWALIKTDLTEKDWVNRPSSGQSEDPHPDRSNRKGLGEQALIRSVRGPSSRQI